MTQKVISLSDPVLGTEESAALKEVIEGGWITLGDYVRRFEREFAELHEQDEAIAVSSGTAALHLAIEGLGIGPGDEVLVPSLTFVASANAVWYAGATPVLVDIKSLHKPHISLEDAARKLTARTKAVMVMHYGGWMCPMTEWKEFAEEHGLLLIEDAAHAPGMSGVCKYSDAAAFSFYGNKNITTAEGGMILVRDCSMGERIRRLRSHGMTTLTLDRYEGHAFSYDVTDLGFNYRLDELRAALGLVQIRHLIEWNERRKELLARYRRLVGEGDGTVVLPFPEEQPTAAHLCPVILPENADRDNVMRRLREKGIHTSIHYPPIHLFSYYVERLGPQRLELTERFCERVLSLPLHPGLDSDDVKRVVDSLSECVSG